MERLVEALEGEKGQQLLDGLLAAIDDYEPEGDLLEPWHRFVGIRMIEAGRSATATQPVPSDVDKVLSPFKECGLI